MLQQKQLFTTCSPEETRTLGQHLGEKLKPGMIIALSGDPGSGKTCFTQGLAKGAGVVEQYITSPTYTLINEYSGRYPFFHVDLYRLGGYLDVEEIGLPEIMDSDGIVVIEWGEKIAKTLPLDSIQIQFDIIDENSRQIQIKGLDMVNLKGLVAAR